RPDDRHRHQPRRLALDANPRCSGGALPQAQLEHPTAKRCGSLAHCIPGRSITSNMPARVILWDIMDTLVHDPFFTHMPGFFGHSFEELVPRLRKGTWVDFELGVLDEAAFYERFFRDGSAIDGPGLKRCMS